MTRERACPSCGDQHASTLSDRCDECIEWERKVRWRYGPRSSGVYFVQSGGFVKIGVARNVFSRVHQAVWAWNPHDVTILGWIPEPDEEQATALERRLHKQFADQRHRAEWFHAYGNLMNYIQQHAEPWPRRTPDAKA